MDNLFTHLAYKRNEELVVSVNSNVWNVEWLYVFRADMRSSVSYMLAILDLDKAFHSGRCVERPGACGSTNLTIYTSQGSYQSKLRVFPGLEIRMAE